MLLQFVATGLGVGIICMGLGLWSVMNEMAWLKDRVSFLEMQVNTLASPPHDNDPKQPPASTI